MSNARTHEPGRTGVMSLIRVNCLVLFGLRNDKMNND